MASRAVAPSDLPERSQLAADVRQGLSRPPRWLPSRCFYDALGSALFDAICAMPWYGVARAERRLLDRHASELFERTMPVGTVLELGSGNGEKLRTLLAAAPSGGRPIEVHLVDVSAAALASAARAIATVEGVTAVPHQEEYLAGLDVFGRARPRRGRTLALFLGSNLGNYHPPEAGELLRRIREVLRPDDAFGIGVDLVKPPRRLLLAYDDPLGVTAAFNRNILVHVNRELDGDFAPEAFAHRALWNASQQRVEMHLVSERRQRVRVRRADLDIWLGDGESIWTESSYKYDPAELTRLVEGAGFVRDAQWIDDLDGFALTLFRAI
ncbi:MAG: L-histidine N(alpha)-methyltransferase [Vicinamibacterales bacterium]